MGNYMEIICLNKHELPLMPHELPLMPHEWPLINIRTRK